MGPGHIDNGRIRVREYRTGKESMIPMHPRLVASLTLKRGNRTAFLLSDRGKPFASDESFGLWFSRKCAEAGLKGFCLRGLRQASARRLAEIGVPAKRVEAVTGFSADPQPAQPKRGAEKRSAGKKQGSGQVAEADTAQALALRVETEGFPFPGEYDFPIQIRDGLVVRFSSLPMDLSRDEAEKICRVILALADPAS